MNWRPLKVLFVGDKPSSKNVSKDVPFVGTPSYKRLLRWIGELDLDINQVTLINNDDEITQLWNFDKVIFLGKNSTKGIDIKKIAFDGHDVKLIDHPSPRNRNFNNPDYEKKMLKQLKEYLYG